jgi:polyisoprenoid-binding protein YceI
MKPGPAGQTEKEPAASKGGTLPNIKKERDMNKFKQTAFVLAGLAAAGASTLMAPAPAAADWGGNQLTGSGETHWYQKPAESVGPVKGAAAKEGTVLALKSGSYLYMEGDSTLHKYQIRAGSLEGSAVVKGSPSKDGLVQALQAGKVESMSLVVPVEAFKSRESGLDDNAHKALKAKDNPDITFVLKSESLKPGGTEGSYVMTAQGDLTIAGTTAPVTLTADTTVKDGRVELKGVQKLKMSDFKVTPPSISLLVTSITCTDAIEIDYDVIFAK